ncbi:hypothetical protein I4U23_015613 [Adineta vaga]|nr:hypothetical protein I4U23_015613 [Adineta vaga]
MIDKHGDEEAMAINSPELKPRILSNSQWSRTLRSFERKHFYATLLVLVIVGSVLAVAIPYYRVYNKGSFNNEQEDTNSATQVEELENETPETFGSLNDEPNKDQPSPRLRSASSYRKHKSPENVGHMNVYIRKPTNEGTQRRPHQLRFPVARYNRRRLPFHGPFLSFTPRVPIFVDRLTRQTLIFSPSGVYILPPVINFYGKMFSVAELIASGYASLVSSGAPPVSPINMLSYYQSIPLLGPGIPMISPTTGSFDGGIRTNYKSFKTRKYSRSYSQIDDSYESDEQDEDEDEEYDNGYYKRRKSYPRYKYNTQKPKTLTTTTRSSDTCSSDCDTGCTKTCLRSNAKCRPKLKTISIVTARDQAPFISQTGDDAPVGLDVDLMQSIADLYQIKFVYQYAEFSQFISMVQNDINLISISTHTDTIVREEFVNFAHFFKTGVGFFTLSTYTETINGLSDLCGKTVAVLTSSIQEIDVQSQNTKCGSNPITIISVASSTDRLKAIEDGTADVALDDQAVIVAIVQESEGKLKEVGQPYDIQPFGILCNKNNKQLCCALVNAINYLIKKGTYEDILKKYSYSFKNNGICPSQINLNGTSCSSKCTPSDSECEQKLASTETQLPS